MNKYDYITKLLNFQDKYIEINTYEFKNNTHYIHLIQTKQDNISCPSCGGLSLTTNNSHIRRINDVPINNYPTILLFEQLRYKCNYCKKTFNQETSIVKKGSKLTNNLKTFILNESKMKQSFKDISKRTNISETTVSNEFKEQIHNHRCNLTRIICIDEFKANTIAGKYALIIGDPESGEILDILPSRLQDYIYHYFNTIDKSERLAVKYVVTDLFESYRTICKNLFWNSIHIADRFHWIRLCSEAFNKTRINIMNFHLKVNTPESITYANALKKYHKILLANPYSKESWYFDQQISQNKLGLTTIQTAIEYCVNYDSTLEFSYIMLKKLYYIAKFSSYENARKKLLDWCDEIQESELIIPEFKRVALTYRSWMNEIVNSFILDPITHKRLTNGFIEGKNNFCKVIKRVGFGYKDFDVFRYKIIKANKK